jgi:hypothetical protein
MTKADMTAQPHGKTPTVEPIARGLHHHRRVVGRCCSYRRGSSDANRRSGRESASVRVVVIAATIVATVDIHIAVYVYVVIYIHVAIDVGVPVHVRVYRAIANRNPAPICVAARTSLNRAGDERNSEENGYCEIL